MASDISDAQGKELGHVHEVTLPGGWIRYGSWRGIGELFVHVLLVKADLSRTAVPAVKAAALGIDSHGPFSSTKSFTRLR